MHVAAKNGNWPLCEHFSSLDRTLFLVKDNNGNTPEDIAVLFNRRDTSGDDWAYDMALEIRDIINDDTNPITWPTFCVDGYWLDPAAGVIGDGAYDTPFDSLTSALDNTDPGSKIHAEPGTLGWTGTITKRIRIDAPSGAVRIGE